MLQIQFLIASSFRSYGNILRAYTLNIFTYQIFKEILQKLDPLTGCAVLLKLRRVCVVVLHVYNGPFCL